MSKGYLPPRVEVTSVLNSRLINISDTDRFVVITGAGPSVRTVTDEEVTHGSGSLPITDYVANYGVTVTRVSPYPNASGSYLSWEGNYTTAAGTGDDDLGSIIWNSGSAGVDTPRYGDTYYVSYTYPVSDTQYEPQIFTDSNDLEAFYGLESAADSDITTGAKLVLENGATAVMCLQLSGSLESSSVWSAGLSMLEKKNNISYIIPMDTSSVSRNAILTHCLTQSVVSVGHERSTIFGLPSTASTPDDLIAVAESIANTRASVACPGESVTRTLADGSTLTLDGSYVAAAVAGVISAQDKPRNPVTGMVVTGITIPDDQYLPYDMNRMGGAGVLIVSASSGTNKIRHALTTDVTSADTEEISVRDAIDYVKRITRQKLDDAYIGKGLVIGPTTAAGVAATVKSIWGQLVADEQIYSYGTKADGTTGEVPISAVQDSVEPRRINVTGSIKPLYPLNYISVTFYVYV